MTSSKKNKNKGWIGTILFHGILLLIFLFTGLSYTIPPPPEEGISINFGTSDFGKGEQELETETEQEEKIEESIEQNNPSVDEVITQQTEQTIETEKKEEVKNEKESPVETKEIIEEIIETKEVLNPKSTYTPKKNNKGEGNTKEGGDMGDIDGDPNAINYEGGGFGDGLSKIGSYRKSPVNFDYPIGKGEGYITVNVVVNSEGRIIGIDDRSFKCNFTVLTKNERENLYKAIKQKLRYGATTGADKSDKITNLKINFKH